LLAERLDAQNGYAGSADVSADVSVDDYRRLRARLVAVRQLLPQLRQELGGSPERHPSYQLISRLDDTCSRLIVMVGGMTRQAPSADHAALLSSVHQAEAALLLSLASRLELWQQRFSLRRRTLPQAPEDALQLPDRWLTLNAELNNPALNSAPLQRLQRIATRLLLCRQAEQAIRAAEEQWRSLMPR
ncbi:MAG: FUSC family protein, partial [Vulcanococcus sp.]